MLVVIVDVTVIVTLVIVIVVTIIVTVVIVIVIVVIVVVIVLRECVMHDFVVFRVCCVRFVNLFLSKVVCLLFTFLFFFH